MKKGHITNKRPIEGSACLVCGRTDQLETHEVFGGANRNLSIQYGLQAILCHDHHQGTNGVHGRDGKPLADWLHREGQRKFEERGTRDEFVRRFGKSWI